MASRGRMRGKPFGGNFGTRENHDLSGVSDAMIKSARKSGQLNLSNRDLTSVPDKVWRVNLDAAVEAREVSFDANDRWWDQIPLTKLILASNKLTSLSPDVQQLSALVVLDVHDNQLETLPDSLGALEPLQRLNISHNKLTTLPEGLLACANLSFLHVEHNCLKELPDGLGSLVNLEDLDVSHNELSALPPSIGKMTTLRRLNLSNNKLSALSVDIQGLKDVAFLDLTHNQLTILPDELGQMRTLEQLYLRHNKLKALPLLQLCSNLKELHLGNNLITELGPEQLACLSSSLCVLDIRDNKMAVLPQEVTLLEQLERLDVTNNDLSGLPYELGNMVKLKSLVVDGNPMRSIRRDIIARGSEGLKKYLRSRIETEPVAVQSAVQTNPVAGGIFGGGDQINAHSVKQSKALDYSGKRVAEIPADVWELGVASECTQVNFSKNQLPSWPDNMMTLVDSVTHINLGFNRIAQLPPDVGLFLQLQDLDLRNNCLMSLPDKMESLQNLHTLTLSFNRFTEIPSVIYTLASLENLLMSDCQVATMDIKALQRLARLAVLDLQNNNMSSIPAELGNCTTLRSLLLVGNPCKNPRPAMLSKGTDALLEYLRGRIVQ